MILAEGLTVECYLDVGDRADFERDGKVMRLSPNFTMSWSGAATATLWEARGAAPLVTAGLLLRTARRAARMPLGVGRLSE